MATFVEVGGADWIEDIVVYTFTEDDD